MGSPFRGLGVHGHWYQGSAKLGILMVLSLGGCSSKDRSETDRVSQALSALVNGMIETESESPIHSVVLQVESPNIEWRGAAGLADARSEEMTPAHKFKIASITKTLTATVVLQLIEEGRLALNTPLGEIFGPSEVDLDKLHVLEGTSYGAQITVEQLLGHTSGIRDYMEDPRFIPDVLNDPERQWSPHAILERHFDYGTYANPGFRPGQGWMYADVNYVLLGMVVEKISGSTLHEQMRERLFDPLGMENSYLEFYEAPRGEMPLSHAFYADVDLAESVNTSFDWGGGGLVSTCPELSTFFRALIQGQLFEDHLTLERMLAAADRGLGGEQFTYGLGIMKRPIHGVTFYGHGGAYDADVFYAPNEDLGVCTALNQMETHGKRDELLHGAVELALSIEAAGSE